MHLAELSRRSGVSVPSIKFYLREGLVPPGTPVSARRAEYGEEHVRRLRLVRAMLTIGKMSVAQARDVLAVADDPAFTRHERLGTAQYMLPPHAEAPAQDSEERAVWDEIRSLILDELRRLGWHFQDTAPALDMLTQSVATLVGLGYDAPVEDFRRYAAAIRPMAEAEYATIAQFELIEEALEATVAYTVLVEPILLALRRLAHEDVSSRLRYGYGDEPAL
ncbi:MerR family transcriptional regulator [Catenulispora pinisilvae]|uniref:MerR family transcriptional regulator n=1 Tax=Catenulispora pinisilvae TaxID=2705253 RepID=UPI001890E334|nr:MerR family transcriptional regulator [Catenulispora pinisilvae]